MIRRSTGEYPPNWKEIAAAVKDAAGWKCIRCGHAHDPKSGHTLTVHHLDINPANCAWWNLAALCQKCHLKIQAKVVMERPWMFHHSEWFKPYVVSYNLGLKCTDYYESLIWLPPAWVEQNLAYLYPAVGLSVIADATRSPQTP